MALKFALVLLVACSVHCFYLPKHEFEATKLGNAIDKASMKLLKEAYSIAGDKNGVSSPLGVLLLLSQYAVGTSESGNLRQEIVNYLGSENYDKLLENYSQLAGKLASLDQHALTLRNKVYVGQEYQLEENFSTISSKQFKNDVEKLNFKETSAAVKTINKWAEEETKGLIKEAVSPDAITPDVVAALFNVIYFKGHWAVPFNTERKMEIEFHETKDKITKLEGMHIYQPLYYRESSLLDSRLVELPYKEEGFRMIVVLPNEVEGLSSVVDKVAEHGLLGEVSEMKLTSRDVCLLLPKFEINTEIDLSVILPKIGVTSLFTEGAPHIAKSAQVVVSKAFQKAFFKVDEEGTTAAAVTGAIAVATSLVNPGPEPIFYHADRPFLYAVLHEDKVLFVGTQTHF